MIRLALLMILIAICGMSQTGAQAPDPVLRQLEQPGAAVSREKAARLPGDENHWYDIRELTIEGKGWSDTQEFYDRLPGRAKALVRNEVWSLAQDSAGICARFATNARTIKARWAVRQDRLAMDHMPATGVSGLDLYVRNNHGGWGWIGVGRPTESPTNQKDLVRDLPPGWHEFLLYLPLYNGVSSVQIGIAPEFEISKAPLRPAERNKPICFYGTSIVQGGCASRPGMAHPAILGRRLDYPVINLGFSGNGPMELELARLMAELDPAAYVIDCLPNMQPAQVSERALPFVKILREARPNVPILLIENISYQGAPYLPGRKEGYTAKNAELLKAHQQMIQNGIQGLFYLSGGDLLGHDQEATVDGTHPTDLGFIRMADAIEPVLRKALIR